ncbi:MAG: PadR family transcriptional regulator [Sulfolobales archaeon]
MSMYKRYREDLRILVLDILSKSPKHAYALTTELEDLIGFRPPTSIVYPLLRSLNREGLIEYFEEEKGRRKLKIYQLTDNGRNYLEKNKDLLEKALNHAYKHRLLREVGVTRIFNILKELHENIDKLSKEQLEEIKHVIMFFEKDLRNIILLRR